MKVLRITFLFPIALLRLFFLLFISGFVVTIGWFWLSCYGFSQKLQHWVMQTWGKSIVFILGIRIDHNGLPESKNFILMPNHRSYLDIFIVAKLIPTAMVGKAELEKWPFTRLGGKITNSIFVNRSDVKSMISAMNKIKVSVNQNIPVTLFPEGTTFKGPQTKPFKKGSFKIAAETGIPIIPMAIHYKDANDAWVGNDTFLGHFFRQMGKPVSKVSVRYGQPVSNSDYRLLQQEVKTEIDKMLTELENQPGKFLFRLNQ